jgi:hypothetical protein
MGVAHKGDSSRFDKIKDLTGVLFFPCGNYVVRAKKGPGSHIKGVIDISKLFPAKV